MKKLILFLFFIIIFVSCSRGPAVNEYFDFSQVGIIELTNVVENLRDAVSEQRDEILLLKQNYTTLVQDMSTRLEVIYTRFQNQGKSSGRA